MTLGQEALLLFFTSHALLLVSRRIAPWLRTTRASASYELLAVNAKHVGDDVEANEQEEATFDAVDSVAVPVSDTHLLQGVPSVQTLGALTRFGVLMLLFYMGDCTDLVTKGPRSYSRDFFLFIFALFLIAGLFTWEETREKDILNRDQTDEWRGWMQFGFLAYHYFKAAETYNYIRLFISAYVWQTGFGNFSYFYIRRDFSLVRLLRMLWRLNFMLIFVVPTMDRPYMLYYIIPMHTLWFLFVYATMAPFNSLNYTPWGMRLKFLLGCILLYFLFEVDGVFETVFAPFSFLLSFGGTLHEWHFRTHLDHWAPLFGMIMAFNFPVYTAFLRRMEKLPPIRCWIVRVSVILALLSIVGVWYSYVFVLPKVEYNDLHPYFSIIPITAFIFLRNLTPTLRSHKLAAIRALGKITLETYIAQHHVWLTSDAKTRLSLIPEYPLVNFLVCTIIFILIARQLFNTTMDLRDAFLPDNKWKCLHHLWQAAVAGGFFVFVAVWTRSCSSVVVTGMAIPPCALCLMVAYRFLHKCDLM